LSNQSTLADLYQEIEHLRSDMYKRYSEKGDPQALVAISQELDQKLNLLYHLKSHKSSCVRVQEHLT